MIARRPPKLLALYTLLLSLAACTYLRETIGLGPQRPRVSVSEVQVTKASLAALELLVTLRVDNPNGFALDFRQLKYDMTAEGKTIAAGKFDERLSIPAEGRSLVKLPVTVDPDAALRIAKDVLTKDVNTEALLKATAIFASPFGDMDVSFEDRRSIKKIAGF